MENFSFSVSFVDFVHLFARIHPFYPRSKNSKKDEPNIHKVIDKKLPARIQYHVSSEDEASCQYVCLMESEYLHA